MSNFTDDEDRQLVQLAASFGSLISWDRLAARMPRSRHSKSKEELRQRLKTLKRTHGRDLRKFPPWFFRKQCVDITTRLCSAKSAATPSKRLLPPLELVCRLRAATKRRVYEDDCFWKASMLLISGSTFYRQYITREHLSAQATTNREHPRHDTLHCCREGDRELSSLELLANVAAEVPGRLF